MDSQRSVYASNNFFPNLLMFIFILRSFETNDLKKKTAFLGNVNVEVIFLEKKNVTVLYNLSWGRQPYTCNKN